MATDSACIAYELRDGLLQDLVAVGLLIEAARRDLRSADPAAATDRVEEIEALLQRAASALDADIETVRAVIDRLRLAA